MNPLLSPPPTPPHVDRSAPNVPGVDVPQEESIKVKSVPSPKKEPKGAKEPKEPIPSPTVRQPSQEAMPTPTEVVAMVVAVAPLEIAPSTDEAVPMVVSEPPSNEVSVDRSEVAVDHGNQQATAEETEKAKEEPKSAPALPPVPDVLVCSMLPAHMVSEAVRAVALVHSMKRQAPREATSEEGEMGSELEAQVDKKPKAGEDDEDPSQLQLPSKEEVRGQ